MILIIELYSAYYYNNKWNHSPLAISITSQIQWNSIRLNPIAWTQRHWFYSMAYAEMPISEIHTKFIRSISIQIRVDQFSTFEYSSDTPIYFLYVFNLRRGCWWDELGIWTYANETKPTISFQIDIIPFIRCCFFFIRFIFVFSKLHIQ